MKKLYAALGGVVLALSIFFQGSVFTTTAMAAAPAEYTVKESDFESGVWGTNNNGEEIVVAIYNNGKHEVGFLSNDNGSYYGAFKSAPTTVPGTTNASRITIGEVDFTYCEIGERKFILSDDGDVYSVKDISAHDAEQIRS